ncbi:MAG: flagellar basal-body rod protein FlgF [Halanaerobiaceae bacterium]
MIKGLFTAAASMKAASENLDVITNNLSNSETVGFKREEGVKRSFPELMMSHLESDKPAREIGSLGTGVKLDGTYADFRNGDFRYTEGDLDFALDGDGFFAVQTPDEVLYTRAGNFTLNEDGQLVTQQGYQVLGENGQPLEQVTGEEINIDGQGEIHSGLEGADRLQIVGFDDSNLLAHRGENLYETGDARQLDERPDDVQVKQFYLEESNVNIVKEMSNMIEKNRLYEANQKMITSMDETLGQAVTEIARLN